MSFPKAFVAAGIGVASLVLVAAKPKPPVATPALASHAVLGSANDPSSSVAASGVTFNYKITSSSSDKKVREARSSLMTVRIQDGNVRMDYLEGLTPLGEKSGYMLLRAKDASYVVVSPKEKKAVIMSAEAMGSGLGAMLNSPLIKLTFSNMSFRYKDMGAGEEILGHKTRRVRTWYTSTMEMKLPMMPDQKVATSDSSDQWIAPDIGLPEADLEKWAKAFSSGVRSTNPELQAELDKFAKSYGKGLTLRTITWSTETDKKGKATLDTITTEVTDIKMGAIDASMFEIPKGYEVVDMGKAMSDAMASMDSSSGKDGAKKGEEKVSPADAIKEGLGGMFKKKKKN